MTYEFQSSLFNTAREMHEACAGEWLIAGGLNDKNTAIETLKERSAEEMATELFEGWNDLLDRTDEDGDKIWSFETMVDVFEDYKKNPLELFPLDDDEIEEREENAKRFGEVVFESEDYILSEQAWAENYGDTVRYYANGVDRFNRCVLVSWDINEDWDGEDAYYACDWDSPVSVEIKD